MLIYILTYIYVQNISIIYLQININIFLTSLNTYFCRRLYSMHLNLNLRFKSMTLCDYVDIIQVNHKVEVMQYNPLNLPPLMEGLELRLSS